MTDRTKHLMRLMSSATQRLFNVCTSVYGGSADFYKRGLWMLEGLTIGFQEAMSTSEYIDTERVLNFEYELLAFYERRIDHEEV